MEHSVQDKQIFPKDRMKRFYETEMQQTAKLNTRTLYIP